jgi:hypothetical protein
LGMDAGTLNFALKMLQEEFKLTDSEILILGRRLMADEKEFERLWRLYKARMAGSSDRFRDVLRELLD